MDGEGDTETLSFSKDDSAAVFAISRVVKFGYREFVVTGDKWMAIHGQKYRQVLELPVLLQSTS